MRNKNTHSRKSLLRKQCNPQKLFTITTFSVILFCIIQIYLWQCNITYQSFNIPPNDLFNITSNSTRHDIKKGLDSFKLIPHSQIFVRDVFIDRRTNPHMVTVLALAPVNRSHIICKVTDEDGNISIVKESREFYMDGVVPPYCYFKSYLIYCHLKISEKNPVVVGVSVSGKQNTYLMVKPHIISVNEDGRKDIGMCIPKVFGMADDSKNEIIQFMELYRILGVRHAILYDIENSSSAVMDVVRYYQHVGFINVVPWKLPVPNLDKAMYRKKTYVAPPGTEPGIRNSSHHPFCIRRHAQLLSNYHCHLSNIGKFEYLAYPDLDEIFMPRKHKTLQELFMYLESENMLEKTATMVFREAFFCENKTNAQLKSVPHFSNIREEIEISPDRLKAVKTIIKPAVTLVMTIHTAKYAMKGYLKQIVLPIDLATKNHYRRHSGCQSTNLTIDNVLDSYLQELKVNVTRVLDKIQ